MDCRCAFIVQVSLMDEDQVFDFIDEIGIEAGITDDRLYFGLSKKDTSDDFILSDFIHESLALVINKVDKLKKLRSKYKCSYILDIKFSNIEEEIENNQQFIIDDEIKSFLEKTDTYYNLNDGYFDEV